MAKRAKKADLFGKLGFTSSMFSALGGAGALFLIVPRWGYGENLIAMGPTRASLTSLALILTFILGCFGFLAGLEGAANGEGKIKTFGWVGFWIGTIFTMVAIILGLCFKFYSV